MKALFRMIFGTKGHKAEDAMGNHQTTKLSNHQTVRRSNHQTFQRSNAAEECTMHNAPCTISGMKTSRAPRGRLRHVARWAAVAAVAAGAWLGFARDAKADAGDTCYWKGNTSSTNWDADPGPWYNSTRGWDNHTPNYCGHNKLFFDNNNQLKTYNNFSGSGLAFWQVIYTNSSSGGATSAHTVYGSASTASIFYDYGGVNPKIENYTTAAHTLRFLIQIGAGKVLEVNPIGGDLSLSKVYAAGQTMNVYGSKKLTIDQWYAGTNTVNAPSTIYVADAGHVVVTNWRAGSTSYTPWQTVHVNNAGGQVDVRQVSGLSSFEKKGPGKMVYGGNAGTAGTQAQLLLSAGTLVISNFSTTTSPVMATNINLTNTTTVVMKSPAQFRKVALNAGSVVEMDVFNNSSAAYLGVVPGSTTSTHQFAPSSSGVTLKLKGTSGFDPTADACWTVFNGRNDNAISAAEAGYITLNKDDLVNNWGADGTFSSILRGTNSASSTLGSALYVTYTAKKQQAAVGLTQTTFTYAGSAITLTGTGGTGSGAYSYSLVSGSGTLSGSGATCTLAPNAAGSFVIDVTRAASGAYAERTDRVTVTVNKGTQAAVTLSTTTFTYAGSSFTLSGSGGSSGGSYSYVYDADGTGSGSVSNGKLTATAAGTMTVNVTCAGNNLWNSRTDTVTVTVNKGTQANTSLSTTSFTYAGSDITLTGSGGSGSGAYSYSLVSGGTGVGTLSGSGPTCTLSPDAAGTFFVKVIRAADNLYNAKTNQVTVTLNKGTQPTAVTLSTTMFTYSPSGNTLSGSGGTAGSYSYAYGSNGTGRGSVAGSTLSVDAVGTMTIRVTRSGNDLYNSRTDTVEVTVNKASQTVVFREKPLMVTAGKSTNVTAEVTSPATGGGAVTFSGSDASKATVASDGSVTGVAAGKVTITATAAATAFYSSATATYVLTVRVAGPDSSGSIDSVTSIGANTFRVAYTKGSGNYAVLLAKESTVPSTPVDGTGASGEQTASPVSWTDNTQVFAFPTNSTDGTKVIRQGTAASGTVVVTNATPNTHYYLALYSRNPSQNAANRMTNFSYSATAATADFWTLAAEPTGNPALVTPTAAAETLGSGSATINWTKGAGANNTLVVIYGPADSEAAAEALAATAPTDGQVYSTGSGLGGTVLHAGAGTTAVASGLTKLKWYKVVGYSYALGGDDSTANYLMPGAAITFQTQDSNGPQVWATGVDGTSFLLNWSPVAGATTGYDVGAGGEIPLLDDGFTTDEGWATASSSSGYKTAASGKWLLASLDITAASSSTYDNKSHAFFPYNVSATLELPPLTGTVTSVSAYLGVPSANDTERGLALEYYNGSAWTSLGTVSAVFDTAAKTNQVATLTLGSARDVTGQRLRLSRMNANSVFLFHLWVNGSAATGVKGHDMAFTGLTSGDSYTAKVRKNPSGDWSDTLVVKAGVMPGEISADALRDSVTFTWTDEEDGAVGYKVDATTEEPASATVVHACPTNNGLGTNQWSNGSSWLQWEYTGTVSTESVTSSYITKGPGYVSYDSASKGHYLIGRAGQAVVSTNFDLEGATNAVLTFDNCAWNSANASTTIESSRLDVYFRLDGTNEWNYFATCIATNTGDNKWVSQSMPLPRGALDGDTLAVKIVAPNAEYYNSALRGAGVRNIKLTLQKAAGRYGPGHSLTGYPKTIAMPSSHTVTGLDPETKVYFRVQALQGSTNAPTAKSVWVEGEGETSGLVASATAQEDGTILVKWIPPTGTGVVILRGRDERHDPATPLDLASLPSGYEIVTNATGGAYHENTSPASPVEQSCVDSEVLSGWKYYYYIYAATDNGDGTITVGAGPSRTATGETPNAVVKGMVNAIASQGWDGWDVHPWSYKKGRVTNPGPYSDGGWWKSNGMSGVNVKFYESWETDARNSASPTGQYYTNYYGTGTGATDPDCTNQLGITSKTNYYGTHSFRLSGGGSKWWGDGNLYVNTNNAAIQFDNVDLSGYKNVQFSMHIAATNLGLGGDDLHVAISTNGGGNWVAVSSTNAAGWEVVASSYHYGLEVIDGNHGNDGNWDFYFESFEPVPYTYQGNPTSSIPTPEGNPYVLHLPDSATQFMARVMFYDSNGGSKRKMSYFIDEVRLVGEAAMPKPHPVLTNITKNAMTVQWEPVAGADGYTVKLTACEKATGVKLQESFVLNVLADGWTGSGYALSSATNRSGTGYAVLLDGNGDWVSSPLVGAAHTLTFWTKVSAATSGNKLFIEGCEEGSSEWKKIAELDAGSMATEWGSAAMQTVSLPRRQWQKIRFKKATAGANWYIDDVTIYGGGDYAGCAEDMSGVSPGTTVTLAGNANTSQTFTGLDSGQEYFVEVQAYGAPAGYTAYSDWEETASYTAGDFLARADGFEMVRLWWGASASSPILVIAVTNGNASAIATPGVGDTVSVGTEMGTHNGIVIVNSTSSKTAAEGFEHLRPYGSRTEEVEAQYLVFWKQGDYWEGRLETGVTLQTYPGVAEDTIAVTNLTTGANLGTYSAAEGKGWSGGWSVWDNAESYVSVTTGTKAVSGSYTNWGLLGTNKLVGAGGNMIHFDMFATDRTNRVYRRLATPITNGTAWIMATVRAQYVGDDDNKKVGIQLTSRSDDPGAGIFASYGKLQWRYSSEPRLQIATNVVNSMPGGGGIAWSGETGDYTYNLADFGTGAGHQNSSGAHTLVMKYDIDNKTLYLAAFSNVAAIASGGALAPTNPPPTTWAAKKTMDSAPALSGIILLGYGYNGNVDFDEIRVGTAWEDLVGKQTDPPQEVNAAEAWTDGKELVRIAWQYKGAATIGGVDHPLADGVKIYAKEGDGGWLEIYKGKGTNDTVAANAWSRWDHVVAPGSTHQYRVVAYASSKYADPVTAVNRDARPSTVLETGLYGATEYLDTMSYTNNTGFATGVMKGGHGFGDDPSAWTLQGDNTAVWTNVNPETAQAAVYITNAVLGARLPAGNVLKATLGDLQKAGIERHLGGDAWCGGAGQAFYVAFRMAYQWGNTAGRRAGMRITDTNLKYVEIGKALGNDPGYTNRFGVTATADGSSYSTGWAAVADSMRGFGDSSKTNAFLVVAKIYWTAAGRADIRAVHYAIGDSAHPATLPGDETNVTWTATYSNAVISNVRKLELIAQSESSGTIGSAYFDEIRFGTSWEDIIGATEPDDVWTDGLGVEEAADGPYYKGDFATWKITSKQHGPKQSAWVVICSNDTTFANATAASNSTTWLRKEKSGTNWHSVWMGNELQFKGAGTWYGGGVVKGELVTVKSWERPAAWGYRWNQYTVRTLPEPSKTNNAAADPEVFQGDAKLGLAWAPGQDSGRTFPEVMIVRFADGAAAWSPTDGTVYLKGQKVASSAGTVVYRGTNETTLVDKGLNTNATYRYQFYTVNNSHYSEGRSVIGMTSTNAPQVEIDGDPNDWVGVPSDVKNSAALSSGEWIWTDKSGDGRKDTDAAKDADITELRMKVDRTNIYFMARFASLTNEANPYIAVGITTNVNATTGYQELTNEGGDNWLGDEANTFMGGNLFSPASLHYADIQMAVHKVAGEGWQIELFKKGGGSWYGPGGVGDVTWTVAASTNHACVEWKLQRSDLGLKYGSVTPARFTVATFANANGWNNQVVGTSKISDGTSYAVDTIAIAPWGQNDKDLAIGAWDEGIRNNNAEYWFDIWFGETALHNGQPNAPAQYWLNTDTTNKYVPPAAAPEMVVGASPVMHWSQATDSAYDGHTGFIAGYLVEVSTNEYFNGLEGTKENGPVSCRVNLEGATNTSYRYITDSREYWWRVRARDNTGVLSDPSPWHYTVEGKTDNEGPIAKLLYVGTNVMAFVNNDGGYRDEQERSGDATSVLDSELEDGGHNFGFVIEWYDVNGVYATNHMHNQLGSPNPGGFAFNILDVHSDGTPYGRVSPNWDLLLVDRAATDSDPSKAPPPEKVGSTTNNYTWPEDGLVLPTDDGGTETVYCWYIDCGLDKVFHNDETRNTGNSGLVLTNWATNAFSIGNYRTSLDIYLTVSAEDGCTNGAYTQTEWYTPPVYDESGSAGSYAPGPQPGRNGSILSSGWCSDFPHPERNITTNQLLHIHVRDNDTIPPTGSMEKWRTAATNEAGESLLPMVAVSKGTPGAGAWDPTWDNLDANGLVRLPTSEGTGKTLQWHLTDADVVNGGEWISTNKLNFFFNVYDEYLHSGMQTNKVASHEQEKTLSGLVRTNTMFNTGMILGSVGDSWTNWAMYMPGLSKNQREGGSVAHGEGTDPNTVLAWTYSMVQTNLEALLGTEDLLLDTTIGPDPDTGEQLAVTNALKLFAWDSDNNAPGDQEGQEIEFGQLVFTDDDSTRPTIPTENDALGTGTNHVRYGSLAGWTVSGNSSSVTVTTNSQMMRGMTATRLWGGTNGTPLPDRTSGSKAEGVYWVTNTHSITMSRVKDKGRYFEFDLAGLNELQWTADTLVFKSSASSTGPENLELTWLAPGAVTVSNALTSGELTRGWSTNGACVIQTISGFDRIKMAAAGGTGSLKTPTGISTAGKDNARVYFRAGAFGDAGPEADTGPTMTVTVKRNGSTTVGTPLPIKLTDFDATAAAENYRNWLEYNIELPTNAVGSADTYSVEWAVSGVNGSKGFLLRDVGYRIEGAYAGETTLATVTVPKEIDENKDAEASNPFKGYTETTVAMTWTGSVVGTNETRRFRLYAYGGRNAEAGGTWGVKDISIHGIASEPRGHEITDHDMKEGNWTAALEVSDDPAWGYDTVQSGLWIESDGGSYTQYVPHYKLLYPEAYAGHAGEVITSTNYPEGGIIPAVYTYSQDGAFTNATSGWGLDGEASRSAYDHPKVGNQVLLLPGNGSRSVACQTNTLSTAGLVGSVSGATVGGKLSLRALDNAAGIDNSVTVTLELMDSASGVLATKVHNLTASRKVGWGDVVLPQWSVDSRDVAKLRITIAQTDPDGAEVYVDDVQIRTALWGSVPEDEDAEGIANGTVVGAKFRFQGNELGSKTMPLSDSADMSIAGKSHDYLLVSTVYDYDHDREGDALGASYTNRFSLFDDDEDPPALGSRFGGSLGARLGSGANTKHTDSGTNVAVHVTDKDMAEAYAANHDFRLDLDIDAYDYKGWSVTTVDLEYDSSLSRLFTDGGSDNFLTFVMTNDAARYDQPSATNTLGAPVKDWWERTDDVQAAFENQSTDTRKLMPVRAFLTDWDADRANDALTLRDTESLGTQVGLLYFLDSDYVSPGYKPNYTNIEHFFVGTNDVATTFTKIVKGGTPWAAAEKSARELRTNDCTGTSLDAASLIYTNKVYTIYDSELRQPNNFFIMANLGDRSGGVSGQSIAGIRQGATATTPYTNAFGQKFDITNTTAKIYRGGSLVTNLVSHWSTNYSSSQSTTRSIGGAAVQTWLYPSGMARDEVGLLLPSPAVSNDLAVKFDVWDADFDRPGDQRHAEGGELTGPALRVLDNDTTNPNPINGETATMGGEAIPATVDRYSAKWYNADNIATWDVTFDAVNDATNTSDLAQYGTGIDGYKMMLRTADKTTSAGTAWMTAETNALTVTSNSTTHKLTAKLDPLASITQGLTTQLVFAVDADDDRPGDRLGGTGLQVPLAYDITLPTSVAPKGNATGDGHNRLIADTDNADDPTTQFDLTWPISGVGPDDPTDPHHPEYSTKDEDKRNKDMLSPWATYKIYYTNYDETAIASDDDPGSDTKSWVYTNFVTTAKYKSWPSVVSTNTSADSTAGATPYASLTNVVENAGVSSGKQTVRLYDLDFDQHYVVVIVGVDRAGNEGPAGMWSWATNNTIKFAVTQGVVRTSAKINEEFRRWDGSKWVDFTPAEMAALGMERIPTNNAPAKGAMLYWYAAGQTNNETTGVRSGPVKKYYDLIYRDAPSFTENGTEQWNMASSATSTATNSGTSKTNWNYQADAGLSTTNRLRFFRASYHDRWQDTKPGTSEKQYPLASEEVYSMNNIVLSEGFNYVSLQGVPWTNTFEGVFGTDKDMWPAGETAADTNSTQVQFFTATNGELVAEWYYFGADGKWLDSTNGDVTAVNQPAGFFMRPFSINLPEKTTNTAGEVTGWWATHDEGLGAKSGSRSLKSMMWHPIMQVPTNAPDGRFSNTVHRGVGMYNTLSLNLPVAVHPGQLGLSGIKKSNQPWNADTLWVIDSSTKEIRNNSTMYCTTNVDATGREIWKFNRDGGEVPDGFIRPNDILVLKSVTNGTDWTWTYDPTNFYALPDRHMGRDRLE